MRAVTAGLMIGALCLPACTIKVETCPENQTCAPIVNVNAKFCGEIVVGGGAIQQIPCDADAGDASDG